jgi:Protein of unknown function (DUF3551)
MMKHSVNIKLFLIDFPTSSSHLLMTSMLEAMMKITQAILLMSATALPALAFSGSAATAGPIVPRGHYCLSYTLGGTDCSFTSYKQCLETALAYEAECYGKTARDDENDRTRILRW